jgi:hypothetical protein
MVALPAIFKPQITAKYNTRQYMNLLIPVLRLSPFPIDEAAYINLFIFVGYLTTLSKASLYIVE